MWKNTLLILLFSQNLFSQGWVQLSDFAGNKLDDGVGVLINNKAYFGTGLQEGWIPSRNFFVLDLDTYEWDTIAPMPPGQERQYSVTFKGNNSFYVFGGDNYGALSDLYKFNISSNTWNKMSSKPGNGLMGASCMQFGDKVIITGGKIKPEGPVNGEVWEYDITADSWSQKNNFPFIKTTRASAVSFKGEGYLMFGRDDSSRYTNHMYQYKPASDSWLQFPDFPGEGRAYCALEASTQKLVLFAGHSEYNVYHNDVWYFTDTTTGWLPGPQFPALPRRSTMACLAGDRFIFSCGLGHGDVRLKETWMLDVPLAVNNLPAFSKLKIYPQPATDQITISGIEFSGKRICVKDVSGRAVLQHYQPLNETIDIKDLQPGLYLLEVWDRVKLIAARKIIKE